MNRRNFLSLLSMIGLGKLAGLKLIAPDPPRGEYVVTCTTPVPAGTVPGDRIIPTSTQRNLATRTARYEVWDTKMEVFRGYFEADLSEFNPFNL